MHTLSEHLVELSGKQIIVRVNYDVDIIDGKVQDTTRVEDSIETIRALLDHGCKVVLLAHLGRPDGQVVSEMSLAPIRELLEQYLGEPVQFQQTIDTETIRNTGSRIVLLENLRFWPGEESNDSEFAKSLASLGEFYVNEAFANCHRKHASIVALPGLLPHAAGLHLTREVEVLTKARQNPEKPLVVIIGGSKVETKAPLVDTFRDVADMILVGGKIASELSPEHANLPNVKVAHLLPDGKDITPQSGEEFASYVAQAKTVIWNGTMGVFEEPEYRMGTTIIAQAINNAAAFTIVGGGDTETALTVLDMEDNINHISTGGGAMLDLLSHGSLVGIEALN